MAMTTKPTCTGDFGGSCWSFESQIFLWSNSSCSEATDQFSCARSTVQRRMPVRGVFARGQPDFSHTIALGVLFRDRAPHSSRQCVIGNKWFWKIFGSTDQQQKEGLWHPRDWSATKPLSILGILSVQSVSYKGGLFL